MLLVFSNFSIERSRLTCRNLLPRKTSALAASRPPPESTLDPDELGCRLTKSDLDALAADPEIREALGSEETRRAVERVLSAADSSSTSASSALDSEGPRIAALATAVLDCLERAQEKK